MKTTAKAHRIESILSAMETGKTITEQQLARVEKVGGRMLMFRNLRGPEYAGARELCERVEAAVASVMIPCDGEAHGPNGAYIDNCGRCAPRWGVRVNRERVTR